MDSLKSTWQAGSWFSALPVMSSVATIFWVMRPQMNPPQAGNSCFKALHLVYFLLFLFPVFYHQWWNENLRNENLSLAVLIMHMLHYCTSCLHYSLFIYHYCTPAYYSIYFMFYIMYFIPVCLNFCTILFLRFSFYFYLSDFLFIHIDWALLEGANKELELESSPFNRYCGYLSLSCRISNTNGPWILYHWPLIIIGHPAIVSFIFISFPSVGFGRPHFVYFTT